MREPLWATYPNPIRRGDFVSYTISAAEPGARVEIAVYSVNGRLTARLADRHIAGGRMTVRWDGKNDAGALVSPGVYFVRARVGSILRVDRVLITN